MRIANTTLDRNILACYISDVVLGTYFQLPIWIVYQLKFLTFDKIAFYSGLALITEVIAQLPTGAFADIFGRRISLSLGNFLMATPMFLIALYPKPEAMLAFALLWGFGRAFIMGTSKPILYESLARYNKVDAFPKILSKSVIFFQLSAAISIVTGGYLYKVSPNLPFLASGFASLIGVFTSFLFIEDQKKRTSPYLNKFISTAKSGFVEIFKNTYIAKLTILYALTLGIAQTCQQFLMQPFMLELGMSDVARSWAAMAIKIFIAFLGAKILATTSIFKNKYFLLIIPFLMALSLIPAGFSVLPWAYIVFIGIAFNSGNTELFLSPEINKHLNSNIRSTAISMQRMLASIFGTIVQWLSITVILKQSVGSYYSYLGVFSLLIILPLAYSLMRQKHVYEQKNAILNSSTTAN